MEIEYLSALKKPEDTIDLYKSLEWYQLPGYTDEDIANGYQNVKDDILKTLQDMFGGSDFIVGVNFSSVQTE